MTNARGFTLLEVLAVIVLVSLVLGVTLPGLGASSALAHQRRAVAEVRDFDARARLHARAGGPVVLALEEEGRVLSLRRWPRGELLARTAWGGDVAVELRDEADDDEVYFDRAGRSADYDVVVRSDERVARWQVAGWTGWIVEAGQHR